MTTLHDRLEELDYGPAPTGFTIGDVLATGHRARVRRRRGRGAVGALALAVLAAAVVVPVAAHRRAAVGIATTPMPPAYWHLRTTYTADAYPVLTTDEWEGDDRPTYEQPVGATGPQSQQDALEPFLEGQQVSWAELYALPTDPQELTRNLQARIDRTHPATESTTRLLEDAVQVIYLPGPDAVKRAALQLIADQGIAVRDGKDALNRPARIFQLHLSAGQVQTVWVDPTTGRLLMQRQDIGQLPAAGQTWVYRYVGPTDNHTSLPAGP